MERTEPRAIRWDGLSTLATGRTAVPAGATLRFLASPGTTLVLDGLAARTVDGTLCLASTDRELGRWIHDGTLAVLGRALQPLVAPPLRLAAAPAGGDVQWLDTVGVNTPVGLFDVPPGDYRRADDRVLLALARPEPLAPTPLSDAELIARGGTPWTERASSRLPWPFWALLAVLLLRLLDRPERRTGADISKDISRRYQAPRLASLVLLGAALLGFGWTQSHLPKRWARIVGAAGPEAERDLAAAGLGTVRGTAPLPCASATAESPCVEAATASAQLERGIDTRVAAPPRLSLLDVRLPTEVPLGMAAQVRVDVRVEGARGQTLAISAAAPGAPTVTEQRSLASDDEVVRLELPLLPAAEGVLPVVLSARAGSISDGRLSALVVRHRPVRRLVLAGAPSWDARRASELLELAPARVDVITRVGRTAAASRPTGLRAPASLLASPDALAPYASIVLVDVADWLGPEALAGLSTWVARGGGLVVLGRGRLPPSLALGPSPAGPASPPHRFQARWGTERWPVEGFDPAEGALIPGVAVLGDIGEAERPWVVGQTVGQGRVIQFLAQDAWRVSPPGGDARRLASLLGGAVAWVEAAQMPAPVTVAEDARSVLWADAAGWHRTPFGLGGSVLGLPLANLPAALDLPVRLRAEAARAGKPWIETASWAELGRAWGRAPASGTLRRLALLRTHPATWALWAALLTIEVAFRRARRRGGSPAGQAPEEAEATPLRRSA